MAGGEYRPPPHRLRAVREHVIADAAGFSTVMRDKKLNAVFGGLQQEDTLLRLPKGFGSDAPHQESLKLKSFVAWRELNVRKLNPAALPGLLLEDFRSAAPLVKWLRAAGPTP